MYLLFFSAAIDKNIATKHGYFPKFMAPSPYWEKAENNVFKGLVAVSYAFTIAVLVFKWQPVTMNRSLVTDQYLYANRGRDTDANWI